MFQNTLGIVEECDLTFLHVFPYSPREGTPAAKMPQVDPKIRQERAAQLRTLGDRQLQKFLNQNISKTHEVVVEKGNMARAENFTPIKLQGDVEPGALVSVYADGIENQTLTGQRIA